LKAEGRSSNDYQANKQADFLMLMYNLGVKATEKLINQLGYQLPPNWLTANRDYYLARTVHGSTTSRPVFSGIDVILGDNQRATEFLETAIKSDYDDIQGGTTAEGIHIGVMGETLATIQTNFAGVDLRGNQITINPQLPKSWQRLCFTQRFRGVLFNFNLTNKSVIIKTDQDTKINIQGKEINLKQGQSQTVELAERNK
jgi:trehalose 6-phosphate phosphorylase